MNNNSFDINVRILDFHNRKIEINYVSSLCSDELIAYLVEGITNAKGKTLKDCLNMVMSKKKQILPNMNMPCLQDVLL